MANPQFPALIHGNIISVDKVVVGRTVSILNTRLNETLTSVTNELGEYLVDAANYSGAYQVGDTVIISLDDESPEMEDNINIDNARIELR